MGLTSIASQFFLSRQKEIERCARHTESMQQQVLMNLLEQAKDTESVSYTHLDVYKRQALHRAGGRAYRESGQPHRPGGHGAAV